MAIYYVDAQGNKVDPATLDPLTPAFTINTDDGEQHKTLLSRLKGEEPKGDGVTRLTAEHQESKDEPEPTPESDAPRRGRPPASPAVIR